MRYFIQTFGCQMNEHDSERLAGMLEAMGYEPCGSAEEADVVLLNTCCVRESAERRIYGRIAELKRLKMERPHVLVGVGGCLTQQPGAAETVRRRWPHVDFIFGTHNLHQVPELMRRAREEARTVVEIWEEEGESAGDLPVVRTDGVRAWVTIMHGCNNFCSYCIVPYVRGRERSRRPEEIVGEVRGLGEQGFREVTLLGQNVNSYGKDLQQGMDFADLLAALDVIPGIERIRYMTSHPRDFSQKLIDTIAGSEKVCEHVHLPVQAGSNRILRLMNRGYTREAYLDLVARIRAAVPGVAITTDIIVGFPGETGDDFEDTIDLVERAEFDAAFTFLYSPRSGTAAAELPGEPEAGTKKERLHRLMEVQNASSLAANRRLVGRVVQVLVEGPSKTDPAILSGRTRTNKIVLFPADGHRAGALLPVRVREALTWTLKGVVEG